MVSGDYAKQVPLQLSSQPKLLPQGSEDGRPRTRRLLSLNLRPLEREIVHAVAQN